MNIKLYPIEVLSMYGQVLNHKESKLLHGSHCIVGGKALLNQLPKEALAKNVSLHAITSPLENTFNFIEQSRTQGKRVLVLADGDALYFGIGVSLIKRFGKKSVRIHAGISIMQRFCAKLGLAWHNVQNITLHGRPEAWHQLNIALFTNKTVCVLTDDKASPQKIAAFLYARGARHFTMHIAKNMGQTNEKLYSMSLSKAMQHSDEVSNYCTVIIEPKQYLRPTLGLLAKSLKHQNNLMTKNAVRATALSYLRIEPQHTLWDIGAGSGAVALEMCALAYAGRVVAVEKNNKRILDIEKNRQQMGALILDICHGAAPTCLEDLPRPQGIFVGGGLSDANGEEILKHLVYSLDEGGRIVISCVLLETLHKVQNFFQQTTFNWQVLQLSINQSTKLGAGTRLVPENPVFLVVAEKV